MDIRFEVLPFASAEREVPALELPTTLTVTCSPRQGVDHSVEFACRLRDRGHNVVVHAAARAIRSAGHLDELLSRLSAAGIDDVFAIGGDGPPGSGPYRSALALIEAMRAHPRGPRRIGVAAYPEGHPAIGAAELAAALSHKEPLADYLVTQMCFDATAVVEWLSRARSAGVTLPAYVGVPGAVDRRRLLEVSLRVGVGASIAFVRKQSGVRRLLARRTGPGAELRRLARQPSAAGLGITGFHYFTFNRLLDTVRLEQSIAGAVAAEAAVQPRQGALR